MKKGLLPRRFRRIMADCNRYSMRRTMNKIFENKDSVAKTIMLTVKHEEPLLRNIIKKTYGKDARYSLRPIADALPNVKRFSYTASTLDAIYQTGEIKTEKMLAQLNNCSFPFERFWIEGPSFLKNHNQINEKQRESARLGVLVETNKETHSFRFMLAHDLLNFDHTIELIEKKYNTTMFHVNGVHIRCDFPDYVSVSPEKIDLNDDKLLAKLLSYEAASEKSGISFRSDNDLLIDDLCATADFLTRFFVLLSSNSIPNNLKSATDEQSKDLTRCNNKRKNKGKLPLLPISPIIIDLSLNNQGAVNPYKIRKIQQLLGWTSVRESKPITSKYGRTFSRAAHDRRIPAPVDRRTAPYIVTATKPIDLVLEPTRPVVQRSTPAQESPKYG